MLRWVLLILLALTSDLQAQHTRLYAVVIGNDDPANFMAGSSLGSGLWQSDDTGRTWKQLGWKHIKAYSMDHDSNGRVLYLAAGNGMLKSTDHGESWKVMTDWRVREVMDVKIVRVQPAFIIAATAHGIIRSDNGGHTWSEWNEGLSSTFVSRLLPVGQTIYACTQDGLYTSTDSSREWSRVSKSPPAIRAAAALGPIILAAGDSGVILTDGVGSMADDGKTGTFIWDVHARAVLKGALIAGQRGVGAFQQVWYEGLTNVHAVTTIGTTIFAGTLGEGLWSRKEDTEWQQIALPRANIWSLHTAEIR